MTRTIRVSYDVELDGRADVVMHVDFHRIRDEVTDYAVVLTLSDEQGTRNVRLYDGAHGVNELHRYSKSGVKQPPTPHHPGTLGQGMRLAIAEVKSRYQQMIDTWRSQA